MVRCRSVRPLAVNPSSGSCHGRPTGMASASARPVCRVGERPYVRQEPRVQPGLAALHELRVDRESFAQPEAGVGGPLGEQLDLRPRPLGVDVVGRQGRHAAPVVDTGRDEPPVLLVHQVRRGLETAGRSHDVPGDGDGRDEVVQLGVRHAAHRRVRLGAEVLDDQLLDAVVGTGDPAQREQRLGALLVRLADPDQQPAGERHRAASGVLQHPQPYRRLLVRRSVVRAARLGPQTGRRWSPASCPWRARRA